MSGTQTLEEAVEFAENPEPRCSCVLLLDTSGSMTGAKIDALNQGLQAFKADLVKDSLASRRVEVVVVTFDSEVKVVQDFVTVDQFDPPTLKAGGLTYMGTAILHVLDMIQNRKAQYRANGIPYYRPWVFMITDGEPQGESEEVVKQATSRIQLDDNNDNKRVAFFAVGVEGANMKRLGEIVVRPPIKLTGMNFNEMFVWLSSSMQQVSRSQLDQQVALPPLGWGQV